MAKVTSYDVAAAAGVSQSAVSRTFSDPSKVAKATRAKVLKVSEQLGYSPNALARSLITGRSQIIAVIASQTTARFYPEVVPALTHALEQRGFKTLLFFTDGRIDRVESVLAEVGQYQVDGVIASTQFAPDRRDMIRALKKPLVLFNRADPENEFKSIICDQNEGGAALASALTRAGRRKIVLVSGNADNYVARHRLFGALDALGSSHVATLEGDFTYERARAMAPEVAQLKPDTVMCMNDSMALGLIDGLDEMGIAVPDDLWVTGFDGTAASALNRYDLTTWVQPLDSMVEAACDLLTQSLAHQKPDSIVESGQLRIGRSAPL